MVNMAFNLYFLTNLLYRLNLVIHKLLLPMHKLFLLLLMPLSENLHKQAKQ